LAPGCGGENLYIPQQLIRPSTKTPHMKMSLAVI
jgi:hypothetical protein